MEKFDSKLSSVIDSTLDMNCKLYGYQYEIIRSYKYRRFLAMAMPEQIEHRLSPISLAPHHSWSKLRSAFGLS